MAVESVTLVPDSASGSWSAERLLREYSYRWEVVTTSSNDDLDTVLGAAGLPAMLSVHPTDALAYVKTKTARHVAPLDGGRWLWEVTVNYSTDFAFLSQEMPAAGGFGGAGSADTPSDVSLANYADPTARVAVWSVQAQTELEAVEEDRTGEAILNSAGFPFLPPLERPVPKVFLTVTKNVASFDLADTDLVGKVNSDSWTPEGQGTTFAAGTVLVTGLAAQAKYENNVGYVELAWSLEYRPGGFVRRVLDRGYCYRDYQGRVVQFLDAYGQPRAEPTPLDGTGAEQDQTTGSPVYLSFYVEETATFTGAIP